MVGLNDFLCENSVHVHEGYSQQVKEQIDMLEKITGDESIKYVCEIGFNGGHSAEIILKSNPKCILVSFDIGHHQDYLYWGKYYIDMTFPNRHHLIIGDSTETIPKFIKDFPTFVFDFIFIDGGHSYEVIKSDIFNCLHLSHANSIYMMDDTYFPLDYHHPIHGGPTRALMKAIESNIVDSRYGHFQDFNGRGFSWGRYKGSKNKMTWEISDVMYPYQFYYGTDDEQLNISSFVYNQCWNKMVIPKDKNSIFGDPCVGTIKHIFYKDKSYLEDEIVVLDYDEDLDISYGINDKKIPIKTFLIKNCIVEILLNAKNMSHLNKQDQDNDMNERNIYIKNKGQIWKFSEKDTVSIDLCINSVEKIH